MNTSSKFILLFITTLALMTACDDANPVEEYHFGSFTAELLALPGATTLDVYVGDAKTDTLSAGMKIGVDPQKMLSAGNPTTISFKKTGTDTLVLDTTLLVAMGEKAAIRIAYSTTLGIMSFTTGSNAVVNADSTAFFLFNQVPDELLPDSVVVNGYLFKNNTETGEFEETGMVWRNLEKNKLHSSMATVRVYAEDGTPFTYTIKLKNVATGQFIQDAFGLETISLNFEAGQREIITLTAYTTRNKLKFTSQYAVY